MSSFEDRQSSVTRDLSLMEQASQLPPVEQLPFPDSSPFSVRKTRLVDFTYAPAMTGPLEAATSSPGVTGVLPEVQTGALPTPFSRNTTTSLRQPIVIRGSARKSKLARPPRGRPWVISAAVVFLMLMITLGTAMAVSPAGSDGGQQLNPLQAIVGNIFHGSSNNLSLQAQQMATATASTQQGGGSNPQPGGGQYFGGGGGGVGGGQGGSGGLNRFAYGECTYWANMRYHALTGYWVPWQGNAYQWYYGAEAYGWIVSSTPKVPSIIVLQPGVQGAGYLGHVAIVEKINPDGSVLTSNYNWDGYWNYETFVTFRPGPGVSFVWHS